MKRKSPWKAIAIVTAIVGAVVAIAGYLQKKSKRISEELDFDNSMFFEDEPTMTYDENDENDQDSEELSNMDETQEISEEFEEDTEDDVEFNKNQD